MKIGIRAHDLGKLDDIQLIDKLHKYNIYNIQFVPNKCLKNYDIHNYKLDDYISLSSNLKDNDINISLVGAYFNPVHSNYDKRIEGINRFKEMISYCQSLGCNNVGSETGSFNDDKWTYNPLNRTKKGYDIVLNTFKELAIIASNYKVNVCVEGAYNHIIFSPSKMKELVDEIDMTNVKVIFDLYNYLSISNHVQRKIIFENGLSLLKDRIIIFHLKDYIVDNNNLVQVPLGKGIINFEYMIKRINEVVPDAILILEGTKEEDLTFSLDYLNSIINKII